MGNRITGIGAYMPKTIWSSDYVGSLINEGKDWIVSRTGIEQRFVSNELETTSTMATEASQEAIKNAGISPQDVGLIVLSTSVPDVYIPSTACIIQNNLNIKGCPAFDVHATCAGFIYALTIADNYIKSGSCKHALVVCAELTTKISRYIDAKEILILPSDAAAAVVISETPNTGIIDTSIGADGSMHDVMYSRNGLLDRHNKIELIMDGKRLFKHAVTTMSYEINKILNSNNLTIDDIDWLIPHQANKRIVDAVAHRVGISSEKAVITVTEHGNTSSSSIPLALYSFMKSNKIKKNDLCLLVAFGAGSVWGATLLKI